MKKLWVFLLVLGVCSTAGTAVAGSVATDSPFQVQGSGTISVSGPFSGRAQGNQIGKGTFSGSFRVIGPILPCSAGSTVPNLTKAQVLTAGNGDTIKQTTVGTACQSGPNTFPATETYTIIGGTGRFSTATGSGAQTSVADFFNGLAFVGTYTFTQDGTISLK